MDLIEGLGLSARQVLGVLDFRGCRFEYHRQRPQTPRGRRTGLTLKAGLDFGGELVYLVLDRVELADSGKHRVFAVQPRLRPEFLLYQPLVDLLPIRTRHDYLPPLFAC
ncbi:hypothetical protein [Sciscionella sediminilitoris]|uniref:hypothetical protein n=1 Tax=Sciscionella sediminilitoris TaxID=1445613 RepID=UPI0012E171D3|nr:hypothetical protein [Sciscionella sp. SE31]